MILRTAPLLTSLALGAALCSPAAAQATYHINTDCGDDAWTGVSDICQAPDGPKRTIGAGIAAAASGDTLLLAPGVYAGAGNVNLAFSTDLRLVGAAGAAATIIDGGSAAGPALDISFTGPEHPEIRGITFRNLVAPFSGGAIILYDASPLIADCIFENNRVTGGYDGGAIFAFDLAEPTIVNCLFEGNAAEGNGGAIFGFIGIATAINCTFIDNTAGSAGHAAALGVTIHNSILRGGPGQLASLIGGATYSNIEGGYPGEGNIDADPRFVDAAGGDYRLAAGSPSIDAGDSSAVPAPITTDFDGGPRIVDDPATPDTGLPRSAGGPVVDMGAWEFQPCYADCDGSGALDFFDFLCFQNEFAAGGPYADCDASGELDFFDFLCFQAIFAAGCS